MSLKESLTGLLRQTERITGYTAAPPPMLHRAAFMLGVRTFSPSHHGQPLVYSLHILDPLCNMWSLGTGFFPVEQHFEVNLGCDITMANHIPWHGCTS